MEVPTILQMATFAIALVGAVLGIINTWNAVADRKPNARVRFLNVRFVNEMEHLGYSIEVTNLSSFPLTINEVGFSLTPRWSSEIERLVLLPDDQFGASLPKKIEPREQADFRMVGKIKGRSPKMIKSVYAKTACGNVFRTNSELVKQIAKQSSNAPSSEGQFRLD
ncbi:hypothetical protein FGU71_10205 [Erythrobacter insulae]|uniref:Uncharacterized protein n=1 Tax=Erythrobacter insulae TaxID=2584124 RepID=A0A547PDJ5_9SPHN|nr:hypothetical protein [Erythrobacter insulae]TRD12195.1 hypothetical protein FGU71_10205 [Erythrobacter insulae]